VPGRIERVGSASPDLTDYVGLTDVALRRRREPAEGLFIAEGEKVIRRAVDAGYPPRSFLLEEKWLPALADLVERVDVPVYLASQETLEEITGYVVHRGALAAMSRLPLEPARDLLTRVARQPPCRVAVFEDMVSHTNLGAALRSSAALGVDAVLVTPRCADPLYRRSVRVSMGAVFQVPWTRLDAWPEDIQLLRELGFTTAALSLADESVSLDELAAHRHERLALVLGTEGEGLSSSTVAAADLSVRIPMSGGVDSLNVAAAAAVAFYATRKART
jgi:tRNA G18 (ribose-2'-O)-methylase SpoU